MIDHPDKLSEQESNMLQKAILPEDSFDFLEDLTSTDKSSLLDSILPGNKAYAEEKKSDCTLVYPIGFSKTSAILYYKENVLEEKVSLTKDLIMLASYKYNLILGNYKKECIYFNISDTLPAVVGSQTYEYNGKVILQISNKLPLNDYFGVLLEKLFYIYGAPLFTTNSLQIDWLRQATSVWAIDHVFPNLNYEHRYIPYIYTKIFDPYYLTSLDGVKSWYQYFIYITQVVGKSTYVKDIYQYIISHPNDYDMNRILSVGVDEAGFRKYIAKFGMCLTGGDAYSGTLSSIDSMTQYIFLPDESLSAADVKELKLSDWKDVGLYSGDYYHVFISTNNLEEGLDIINNMGPEISKKRGMAIGLTTNNQTEWVMTPDNEMPLYHIDFTTTPADYIHILIYNSDMMKINTYQYALGQEASTLGSGNLKVTYSKESNIDGTHIYEEANWSADEVLEKIKLDGSSDMNGLWHTMIGESYMVKEIALDYRYKKEITKEESGFEEKTSASGLYFYNSAEDATSTNPVESLIPDLDGLTDQLNLATEMLEGLPGVDLGDTAMPDTSSLENYSAYANIDMKELLDKIKGISSTGNAANVMTLNGKGPVEMDMGGLGKGGTLLESVHFDGQKIIALLSWIDTVDGTTYKCSIELSYSFK